MESSLEVARENILAAVKSDCDDDDEPPAASSGDGTSNPKVEVVGDKGYHKGALLVRLEESGFRPYIPPREQVGKRRWNDKDPKLVRAVLNNRRRSARAKAKAYHRRRGELVERTFAHARETGAHRRTRLRGLENMSKRYVIQAAALNLGLILRTQLGWATPRGLADAAVAFFAMLWTIARAHINFEPPRRPPQQAAGEVGATTALAERTSSYSAQERLFSPGS